MPIQLVPHNPAWSQQFEAEAKKLLLALGGSAWEGGVAYLLEHIGSTSIPDIAAKPWIDMAVAVYPFPLEEEFVKVLESLGYTYKGEKAGRQTFWSESNVYHLHVFEAGGDLFSDTLLFRDYLRFNKNARQHYEKLKLELARHYPNNYKAYSEGKTPLIENLLREAHTWYIQKTDFKPVEFVAKELHGISVPWCVASGWGLDLFLGKPTRYHADLDICIWRGDQQPFLKHLKTRGWQLHVPVEGKYRPWQEGEFLELPLIQVHCRRDDMPFELLDILLAEHDDMNWIYRREPKITMPKDNVMLEARGITILNPAITILFKSRTADKEPRGKDQRDFEGMLSSLNHEQKQWLDRAFELWMPDHPWRKRLKNNEPCL